jgi:hypothetical protein
MASNGIVEAINISGYSAFSLEARLPADAPKPKPTPIIVHQRCSKAEVAPSENSEEEGNPMTIHLFSYLFTWAFSKPMNHH